MHVQPVEQKQGAIDLDLIMKGSGRACWPTGALGKIPVGPLKMCLKMARLCKPKFLLHARYLKEISS